MKYNHILSIISTAVPAVIRVIFEMKLSSLRDELKR
jgi:hypothetical protein